MRASLRWERASKRFADRRALDALSLAVYPGTILGLLGSNGAGKSTAMELACGALDPTDGRVWLHEADPRDLLARQRLGVMPQHIAAPEDLTVAELIRLWSASYREAAAFDEVVERAQVGAFLSERFGRLSGGQARRLGFALAICGRPSVLLLDEPTAGLDVAARRALWREIRRQAAEGAAVVVTSHYLEEIDALADVVALIARGRLVAHGSLGDVKRQVSLRVVRFVATLEQEPLLVLGAQRVERDGERWVAYCEEAEAFVARLLAATTVRELEVHGPSLEEAVARLTSAEE